MCGKFFMVLRVSGWHWVTIGRVVGGYWFRIAFYSSDYWKPKNIYGAGKHWNRKRIGQPGAAHGADRHLGRQNHGIGDAEERVTAARYR